MRIQLTDWMAKRVITVDQNDSVLKAVRLMKRKKVGSLIVINASEKPVGMFTERDVVNRVIAERLDPENVIVKNVMTNKIVTADINSSLIDVTRKMKRNKLRRIPITEGGIVIGVLSSRDLIKIMSS